ncbi:hypothetical protein GO730_18005 [Spirosoma sp. HMF3257]|uniref:Porin family protein n=1 Tax=Spirosoma telluris TaxID=2183553 RepID=A0A327NK80_9BACT|nr:hypothetical protein [Spirosoma telluris]RAI75572.1 hypothetical protein HMF3257_17925 [Spirosoma telluris]
MKALLLTLLWVTPLSVLAQKKTYELTFSYGGYSSPSFKKNQLRDYVSADMGYRLTNRLTVTAGFMAGKFDYYDDIPTIPTGLIYAQFIYILDNPNARGTERHGYAMAKYALIATNKFNLQLGAGAGILNQRLDYSYRNEWYQASFTQLEFPISLEGYYLLANRIGFGVKAGGFVQPAFPLLGVHIGPQIRVSF